VLVTIIKGCTHEDEGTRKRREGERVAAIVKDTLIEVNASYHVAFWGTDCMKFFGPFLQVELSWKDRDIAYARLGSWRALMFNILSVIFGILFLALNIWVNFFYKPHSNST
jgi:hypothetical protein